ncbi:uncharacterized protein LY89DRAFT_581524 [Mollisia scopiformis]|uniref:Thioredoxin domain-containing protein n=1 Tax=Mollisia scopiformis TaxID=149040 RepID=A0A194XH34_MOLSC|nr:uncharacterized protein LY89DRAFT_581524 [Mollisia scopiformis]KUJ19451.1 hypothetical protein LY89DRAFT_581524 [Mollisia scopiformis]
MPLTVTNEAPAAVAAWLKSTATPTKSSFLVVYASLTNGRSWCGDCREAESFVNSKFASGAEEVKVAYAGQRDEWRNSDNPWRQAPFSVTNLPTLIKVTGDGAFEKLVEGDVYSQKKLDSFVGDPTKPLL